LTAKEVKVMASESSAHMAPVSEQYPSVGMPQSVMRSGGVQKNSAAKPSPGDGNNGETGNTKPPSGDDIEKALVKVNNLAKSLSRKLQFSYDDRIEKIIVRVMEGDSEKVIRQIPPEEMIRLSIKMDEMMGMLINQSI
jgi:flagellar protein FlaG